MNPTEFVFRECDKCGRRAFMRPQSDGRLRCGPCLGMVRLPPELDAEPLELVKCDACGLKKPVPAPDLRSFADGGFVCQECTANPPNVPAVEGFPWGVVAVASALVMAGFVAGWLLASLAQKS